MKTYILHLERAFERGKHMIKEAEKHNLDYEIFKAFDCLNLTENDFEKFVDIQAMKKSPSWLTPGMVCACYSHYLIYQKIIADNVECALITEDDVIFTEEILDILSEIEKNIYKNEVILLHYMSFSSVKLKSGKLVKLTKKYRLFNGEDEFPNVNSAAGYVITKDAAKTLSNIILPVKYGTDSWRDFKRDNGIKSLRFVYPMPIHVVGFKSMATASKSKIWNGLTEFIDNNKIPPFYQLLRYMRLKSIKSRSNIILD